MARTGRRPGNQDTREAILDAAREAFAERGYDGASIRQIATGAGVDPALVHHYFGAKDKLFLAALQVPIDPGEVLPRALAGGIDGVGERLVRVFLSVWDSPAGTTAAAIMRSALQHDWSARMLREFATRQILRRVLTSLHIDDEDAPLRASLVGSQVIGLAMARYIIKLEPLASAPADEVAAAIGPTIQRYLTEPVTRSPASKPTRHA
jgi:AcrR family transcriptional regulator